MNISNRLRELREAKGLSQGDIERRTGLLRTYISRVEGGHTTPSLETLEKLSKALEIDLYQLTYPGKYRPRAPKKPKQAFPSKAMKRIVRLFAGTESSPSQDADEVFATLSKVFSKL